MYNKVEENLITKNLVDFQNTSMIEELFILASIKETNVIEKARLLVKKSGLNTPNRLMHNINVLKIVHKELFS